MTSGGRRDRAGRPFKDGIPRKKLTLALRTDLLAQLVPQAQAKKISLADHINQLLADQLQQSAPAAGQKPTVPAQAKTPVTKARQPEPRKIAASASAVPLPFDELLQQLDEVDRELALPLDEDTSEPVPTYKELFSLASQWDEDTAPDQAREVQYWRRHYRQDAIFRKAIDHLADWTHDRFRDLLLDNRLPLVSHEEALALSDLPASALKITAARLLRGEKDLKQALKGYKELFRQAATRHLQWKDPSHPQAYRFASEPEPDQTQAEPVPSYRELQSLVQKWEFNSSVNRRSQQVQYWRKAYRKDKAFRMAVDHIQAKTPNGVRDLLLDGLLPLGSHQEVLGLADLPAETLKRVLFQILKGERSLKRALGSDAESFRQAMTSQAREKDPLFTTYHFFEEI